MKFYTYKKQVVLKSGEKVGYIRGKGYYAIPAPKPAPARDLARARYVLFAAQQPLSALSASTKYTVAFSADMAYRGENAEAIPRFKAAGYRTAGWCDCRVNGGTPAQVGIDFVAEYKLDYFIGQAESQAEFENAMSVHAAVVVGNLTALNQTQIDRCLKDVLLIQEDYWNEGWGRAQHPAIAAYCAGIYPTALWNPQIQNYKDAGRWREGDGLYHVASVEDWQNLP